LKNYKVLIIGGDSEIGKYFAAHLLKKNIYFHLTSKRKERTKKNSVNYLNLNNLDSFDKLDYLKFTHALISIGFTSINYCQNNKAISDFINVHQIKIIINKLNQANIKIIYLSSDKVFNENTTLNNINSKTNSKSIYGKQKIKIEEYLKLKSKKYTILRLTKVISEENKLINHWIEKLRNNKKIYVFEDELISPIYIKNVINFLYILVIKDLNGIFHLTAKDTISYYNLALILAKKKQFDSSLIISTISDNKFKKINKMPSLKYKTNKFYKNKPSKSLDIMKYF